MTSGLMMANWPRRILVVVSFFAAAALLAESHRLSGGQQAAAAPGQPDAVIVGDSLTGGNVDYIRPTLRNAG